MVRGRLPSMRFDQKYAATPIEEQSDDYYTYDTNHMNLMHNKSSVSSKGINVSTHSQNPTANSGDGVSPSNKRVISSGN